MANLMSDRARRMRREKGPAERKLWHRLREFNRRGFQFRQQAPIDPYITDFCDHSAKLIVEVDGAQHGEAKGLVADGRRTRWLESQGYRVLRFWNREVLTNIGGVEVTLMLALGLLNEDGTDGPNVGQTVSSPIERLRKKARRLARLRAAPRRTGQRVSRNVPSPIAPEARLRHDVGEGQGGGDGRTSDVVVPPTPSPSPQGGGESRRSRGTR